MQVQFKSALIIVGTLIIGMILGGLVHGAIRTHYFKPGERPGGPDRFQMMLTRMAQPDEDQQEAFDEVLDRYSEKFIGQQKRHRVQMEAMVDSLTKDLSGILRPEQIENLKERLTRFPRGGPPHGRGFNRQGRKGN